MSAAQQFAAFLDESSRRWRQNYRYRARLVAEAPGYNPRAKRKSHRAAA